MVLDQGLASRKIHVDCMARSVLDGFVGRLQVGETEQGACRDAHFRVPFDAIRNKESKVVILVMKQLAWTESNVRFN